MEVESYSSRKLMQPADEGLDKEKQGVVVREDEVR